MVGNEFKISYASKDEAMISRLANQIYNEDLNNISNIKENSVTFKTMYIFEQENQIEVKVFIINSTKKKVNFDYLPLSIVDENNELVAMEDIEVSDIGEIPPMNARPYSIFFSKHSIISGKTINDKCKLIIQANRAAGKISNRVPVDYVDEKIIMYDKKEIDNYINNMQPIVKNELKVIPFKSGVDEVGNKFTIIIVANGSSEDIALNNINIIYKDAIGLVQASKKIHILPKVLKYSISVFKIIIEKEDIFKKSFDPEKCTITLTL